MADALRKTTIEIDWKVNNSGLVKANDETDKIIAKSGQMQSGYNQSASAINNASTSMGKYNNSAQQGTSNVVQMGRQSTTTFNQMGTALNSNATSATQFGSKATSSFNQASQSANSAKSNVVSMNSAIQNANSSAGGFGSKVKTTMATAKSNVIDLSSKFNNMADGVSGASNKMASSIESGLNKPLNAAKGILTGLLATAGVAGAGSLFNAGIDRLSSIEDAKMSMEVMMGGDVAKAQGFMDQILDFAKTTPYAFTQLSTSAKNLFAYGMDQGDIVPILKAIGDLSAASGKGSEGIDSLASAFGKMQVSGKASGEQLTQITEAGVPALKILANQAGISVEEIQKKIASGEVSAKTAIGGLVKGIAEGTNGVAGQTQALGGVMEKLKQTWKGSLDSMKSSVTSTMATLIEPAKPKIQEGMKWFSEQFKKLPEVVSNSAKFFAPAWAPAQEVFASGRDFIKNDFLPTVFELGKTMGPGFLEGGITALKGFGWVIDNVVKPPILWLKDYSEEHPERMKNIAKYATIGAAGFYAFNKVSGIVKFGTRAIDKLIVKLASIGPTAATSSAQANASINSIGQTANAQVTGTGGKLGKVKQAGSWLFKGSAPIQQALPSANLQHIQAQNALLKSSGQLTMGARASQAMASTSFRLSQSGAALKGLGSVKGFAKSIPGLSWLAAGANLIGTNKKNAGEKIGGSGGMLAGGAVGAKLGASIGTLIAPGIGTAIGTAIGGIGGTIAGSEFGKRMGESIQKNWGSISEWAESHPILGSPVKVINQGIVVGKNIIAGVKKGYKSAKEELDGFFDDPFNTKVKSGKGLSKDTAKQWNAFMKENDSISAKTTKINITGGKISDKEMKEILASYDAMEKQVKTALDAKKEKSAKNIDTLAERGLIDQSTVDSAKRTGEEMNRIRSKMFEDGNQKLKEIENTKQNESLTVTKKQEDEINAIKAKAQTENRELTEEELKKIEWAETVGAANRKAISKKYDEESKVIREKQNSDAAIALSDSAKEQEIIMGNLRENMGKISAKQAADVVSNSYKAKEGVIKAANEKFEESKRMADELYFVTGEIGETEYKEAIRRAEDERDGVVKSAEEKHEGVVTQAKKQAEGHLKEVDWETGESLSKWDQFKISSLETMSAMGSELSKLWSGLTSGIGKFFVDMGNNASSAWQTTQDNVKGFANGIIDGINPVIGFFNSSWKIPRFTTSTTYTKQEYKVANGGGQILYKGSQGNYHGPALVGEEGPELAYNKSTSSMRLLGSNGAEMTQVNSGERILNNRDTMKVLDGGYGKGATLPGFANGLGGNVSDFVQSGVEKGKDFVSNAINGAKDIGETAMEWMQDPVGKVTSLVKAKNGFKNDKGLQGFGYNVIDKVGEGAKSWVEEQLSSFSFGGGVDDETIGSNGVYSYLMNIAQGLMKKYGMSLTSGYRPGDPHDHGKGLAVDIALPGVTNGSPTYKKAADDAIAMPGVKYVITNGLWKQRGQSWVNWPDGDHYDHVHISGEKPTGKVMGDGSSPGGSGVERWRPTIMQALVKNGLPANASYVNAWLKQVNTESGGNEKAIGGNDGLADGNAMGLLQTKPGTFNAYKHAGYNQILRGMDNSLAGINYAKNRYGASGMLGVIGHGHGYEKGGRPAVGKTVLVGENGPELFEADTAGTVHSYDKTRGLFSNNTPSIEFSPQITINVDTKDKEVGSSVKKAVEDAMEDLFAKLKAIYNPGGAF